MRFSTSALAVVLLQISSQLSPNEAFSPALSRAKTSSPSVRKNDSLFARRDDDDGEESLNGSNNKKPAFASSILLASSALQLSTSK
eukprot:scaffold9612_cov79-Skeletonema_marinoi.AAC.2